MRAFIVGNGPSLNHTNLNLLAGEISFGINRIAKIYPQTNWRPTHYVRAEEASTGSDPSVYIEDMQIHTDLKCEIWANEFFAWKTENLRKSGRWRQIRGCSHYNMHFDNPDAPITYHLPRLCTFGSSLHVAIQIALGILKVDTVHLVGCDLGYKHGDKNHFATDYTEGVGELRDARYTELDLLHAHMLAVRAFPGQIFNATIGGTLEVYPRVKYEELF